MTWEIYSYWNTELFFKVFQGVSHILNDGSYYEILILGVTVGSFFAVFSNVIGKTTPVDSFKHLITGAILFWILIIPRTTVTIIDKSFLTQSSAPMTISNIPLSLAFLANTFTHFGLWADQAEETFMSLPSEMHAAGTHMTRKVLIGTVLAETNNALFLHNVTEYTRECVAYDISTGYKSMDDIQNATDTWGALGDTNPAILVTLSEKSGSQIVKNTYTCPEAFTKLTTDKNAISAEIEQRLAGSTFPGMDTASAKAAYSALLTQSMSTFMNESSKTAEEMFQNSVSQNAFLQAIGDVNGNPVSMAKAVVGIDAGATQKKELAKSFVYVITIVELLVYAFFPFIVMMIIFSGPEGLKGLGMVTKILAWLAFVQVSQVVIDNIILMNSASETAKQVTAYGPDSINAWFNAGGVINGMDDQLQNALFSSMVLSWAMVTMASNFGSGLMTGLFGGAQTYNERTATDIAAEGKNTFGESRWNNSQSDTTAAYSHVTSPNLDSGMFSYRNTDGSKTNISSTGGASNHQSDTFNSGGPASAGITSAAAQQHRDAYQNAVMASKRSSESSATAMGSSVGSFASHSNSADVSSMFDDRKGFSQNADIAKNWEQSSQVAQKIADEFGIKDKKTIAGMTTAFATASVGGSLPFLSGEAGLRGEKKDAFEKAMEHGQKLASEGVNSDTQKQTYNEIQKALHDKTYMSSKGIKESDMAGIENKAQSSSDYRRESQVSLDRAHSEMHAYDRLESLSQDKNFDLTKLMTDRDYQAMGNAFRNGDFNTVNKYLDNAIDKYSYSKGAPKTENVSPTSTYNANVSGVRSDAGNNIMDNQMGGTRPGVNDVSQQGRMQQVGGDIRDGQRSVNNGQTSVLASGDQASSSTPSQPSVDPNLKGEVSNGLDRSNSRRDTSKKPSDETPNFGP